MIDHIEKLFAEAEADFVKAEQAIAKMREWIKKHAASLQDANWHVMSEFSQIHFWKGYWEGVKFEPKVIARAFGKDGWKRKKDTFTCGAIHWVKEFDGVTLQIHEAEKVELNPIEDVKL